MDGAAFSAAARPSRFEQELCRVSSPAWWAFVGVVTAILLVLAYLLMDAKMPATRVIAPPTLETPLIPGAGFSVAFHTEKLRQCPGDVAFFLIEERADARPPLVIPLTRWPTRTFRRVGDSPHFALTGYLPRWVRIERGRIRTVARYHCGVSEQEMVQDTAPAAIGRPGQKAPATTAGVDGDE